MLPIILDAASVAFRLFTIAYVLTQWKERSQQKKPKGSADPCRKVRRAFLYALKKCSTRNLRGALRKNARLATDTGTALEARTAVLTSSKNCVDESSGEIPKTGPPPDIIRKW